MKVNFEYEQSRQLMIEGHGITIIRNNPDAADVEMNRLRNQIYTKIIKSTKKSQISKTCQNQNLNRITQ